jgi:hypothetical protein
MPTQSRGHGTPLGRRAGLRDAAGGIENAAQWLALDPAAAVQPAAVAGKRESDTATLKRILVNWQTRTEMLRALHVTWGVPTFVGGGRRERNAGVSRVEFWLDAANRFRVEFARATAVPASEPPRLWHRWIFDGKKITETDWPLGAANPPAGTIYLPDKTPADPWDSLDPLQILVAYHPFFRGTTTHGPAFATPLEFRLAIGNAIRENRHYVKLQRLDAAGRVIENVWVDPARGDVIAFLEQVSRERAIRSLAFQYERDVRWGWLPTAWSYPADRANRDQPTNKAPVTRFACNEKFPAETFALPLSPATMVFDKTTREHYRIAADGTKRDLPEADWPADQRIARALQAKVDFLIEPQPLKDAIAFIATTTRIKILIDERAFEEVGVDTTAEVRTKTKGIKLQEVLDKLSAQCYKPLRYRIRDGILLIEPHPSAR